ncbi:MAG: hypothetical protein HY332_05055 [Chloroflexi bacterium]|nr:hypothetical protein [Chloroflexota bacterium]
MGEALSVMVGEQRSLFSLGSLVQTAALTIYEDHGEIGVGICKAHHVWAENGQEYIAKGPAFSADHWYAATNEYIAYRLADYLGFPILGGRLLQAASDFFFGSDWMPKGTMYDRMDEGLFDRCANKSRVYEIVAFDVWLCNVDRHSRNLIARQSGHIVTMLMNDHSHCLVAPGEKPEQLAGRIDQWLPSQIVELPYVRAAITQAHQLSAAIGHIESVSDGLVTAVVASLPVELLPENERSDVVHFIVSRKARLREMFEADRSFFRNLQGGAL